MVASVIVGIYIYMMNVSTVDDTLQSKECIYYEVCMHLSVVVMRAIGMLYIILSSIIYLFNTISKAHQLFPLEPPALFTKIGNLKC